MVLSSASCNLLCWLGASQAAETYALSVATHAGMVREVRAVVEMKGELKLNPDGKQVTRLPVTVNGQMHYDERVLVAEAEPFRQKDVRFYHRAEADISVGEHQTTNKLQDDHRVIVSEVSANTQTLLSPRGALTRDELELIDLAGSSTILSQLAPSGPVALSETWQPTNETLALLLGLDSVSQSSVESTLRQIEGEIAIIDMKGKVSGAVDGVSSDIELEAKYNIHRGNECVTWLAMSLREDRAVGHAAPGFDVTSRIRVAVDSRPTSSKLTDDLLAGLPLEQAGAPLLSLPSAQGGFTLLHARRWQVMVDRHDVTILRMVDQGDLIAQCNISRLPDFADGQRPQMKALQADIQRALGDTFVDFVEASQVLNEQGLTILRVVAVGQASELPVRWIYYHISHDSGRQAALVFTMDEKAVEKFAEADRVFVSSFEFTAPTDDSAAAVPVRTTGSTGEPTLAP